MAKILVVDDDIELASKVQHWLSIDKNMVEVIHDGQSASDYLSQFAYDIVILDWDLPQMQGIEVLRRFRTKGGTTPVIMLTGKNELKQKEQGLDSGADDYLTKPFHLEELSARVRALLRRPSGLVGTKIEAGDVCLEPKLHRVTKGGVEIVLLPREFALLELFMKNPQEVFSPDALLNRLWPSETEASIETIYTHMKNLRKKVGLEFIKTVKGVGYKLNE